MPEGALGELKMQPMHAEITSCRENCVGNANRPAMRRILLRGLIIFFLSAPYAFPLDELVPPFGFRWNDSMARVEAVLHGAKAKVTSREKKQSREVWTVEGLLHPGLKRTLFTFTQRPLTSLWLKSYYRGWSMD